MEEGEMLEPTLVFLGCCNNISQIGSLENIKQFLIVLEVLVELSTLFWLGQKEKMVLRCGIEY